MKKSKLEEYFSIQNEMFNAAVGIIKELIPYYLKLNQFDYNTGWYRVTTFKGESENTRFSYEWAAEHLNTFYLSKINKEDGVVLEAEERFRYGEGNYYIIEISLEYISNKEDLETLKESLVSQLESFETEKKTHEEQEAREKETKDLELLKQLKEKYESGN